MNEQHSLRREAESAKQLMEFLRGDGNADDEEIVNSAIEGETNLLEAIQVALDAIDECEVLTTGLKAKEKAFAERRKAIENRVEMLRAAIEQAIIQSEIPTPLRLPTATLSKRNINPALVVENEAEIPSRFFLEQPRPAPKLDNKALTDALRERAEKLNAALEDARKIENEAERQAAIRAAHEAHPPIPGAMLDNGGVSLAIRRK